MIATGANVLRSMCNLAFARRHTWFEIPQGLLVWYTLVGIATPVLLLTALEANRHGSGGLLAWYTFFGVVLQVTSSAYSPCQFPWTSIFRS